MADDSVTITDYTGEEEVVTVPAMIGGNPVNVIASGAFAKSKARTVYLPDTVVSVEEGAFSPGQSVVYASAEHDSTGGTGEGIQSGDGTPPEGDTGDDIPPEDVAGPVGIIDSDGSLITTDTDGNLILVDSEGNETVLDDSGKYTAETTPEGEVRIINKDGEAIRVEDDGKVIFHDEEQNTVAVDIHTGSKTVTGADGQAGYEEVEVDEKSAETDTGTGENPKESLSEVESGKPDVKAEQSGPGGTADRSGSAGTEKDTDESTGSSHAAIYIALVCIAVVCICVLISRKKKHGH